MSLYVLTISMVETFFGMLISTNPDQIPVDRISPLSPESKLFASWNVYLGQMRTSYSLAYFWLWYMHTIWTLSGIEYTM